MKVVSLLVWLLWGPLEARAEAPPAVQAEQARLQSEMQKLAQREMWEGVEGLYQQLLALVPDGAEVTYAEHLLGAQAARATGNVTATRERLELAIAQWSTKLATDWLADIDATYGRVTLQVQPRYKGERELRIDQLPFEADRRFALTFAQEKLAQSGSFDGYLPQGTYTFGDQRFTVAPGPPVAIRLEEARPEPQETAPPSVALQGHLRLGVGYGGAGSPRSEGLEPAGFQGFSPQLGLGGGVVLGERLRLRAEGGLWGAARTEQHMTLGYGSLLAGLHLGPLWLEAGPLYTRGSAELVGVDEAALQAYCGSPSIDCDYRSADEPATARLSGTLGAGGVSAGAAVQAAQTGAVGWLVGVDAGAVTDRVRPLSWARLALTVQVGGGSGS